MPEGDHFEKRAADTVVDRVFDSREVQPSNHFGTRCLDLRADTRFLNEQSDCSLDVPAHGSWSRETVLGPPLCRLLDLALRAGLDSDAENQD